MRAVHFKKITNELERDFGKIISLYNNLLHSLKNFSKGDAGAYATFFNQSAMGSYKYFSFNVERLMNLQTSWITHCSNLAQNPIMTSGQNHFLQDWLRQSKAKSFKQTLQLHDAFKELRYDNSKDSLYLESNDPMNISDDEDFMPSLPVPTEEALITLWSQIQRYAVKHKIYNQLKPQIFDLHTEQFDDPMEYKTIDDHCFKI